MSNWNIYVYNTNTLAWDADGTIPRPQADLPDEVTSTQQEITLAEGDVAFIMPETKSKKQPLLFSWFEQDETFKNKIKAYIVDGDYIKIVTHLAGLEYIGRFIALSPTWLVGMTDAWNVDATFVQME